MIFPAAVRGFSDGTVVAKFQECRAPPHHHKKSTTLARKPQSKSGPKHLSVSTDQYIQSQGTTSTPSPYNTFTTELPLNALYASPKELQKTHYFFSCTRAIAALQTESNPADATVPIGEKDRDAVKKARSSSIAQTLTVLVLGGYPAHCDAVGRRRHHVRWLRWGRRRSDPGAEQGFPRGDAVAREGPRRDTHLFLSAVCCQK